MNEQLVEYVSICRVKGQSDDEIKKSLLSSGWKAEQFQDIFDVQKKQSSNESIWYILKDSWSVLGQDWKRMLFAYAVPTILMLVVMAVEIILVMVLWKMISINFNIFLAVLLGAVGFLSLVSITWFSTWGGLCLMMAGNPTLRKLDAKAIRSKAKKLVWRNLALVSWLTMIVIGNIVWLVVPGLIAGLLYSLAIFVQVNEEVSVGEAIKRGRELVRGRVWNFVGNLSVLLGVWVLINLVFGVLGVWLGIPESLQENIAGLLGLVLSLWSSIVMQRVYYKFKNLRGDYELPKRQGLLYYSGILGLILMVGLSLFSIFVLPKLLG